MPEVKVPELAESITEGPLQNGLKMLAILLKKEKQF